jgi:hypothetical protein
MNATTNTDATLNMNTFGQRSTPVCMMCRALPLQLEHQSLSLLLFVRFSYKFSSVICLFVPLAVKIFIIIILLYNFSHEPKNRVRKLINLDIQKEIISKQERGKSVGDLKVVCSFQ